MNRETCAACFFAGALFMNAVPHVVSGSMGQAFQTPLANPPGEGRSSSTVHMLWRFSDLAIGYLLLHCAGAFDIDAIDHAITTAAGAMITGVFLARRFGCLHRGYAPGKSLIR